MNRTAKGFARIGLVAFGLVFIHGCQGCEGDACVVDDECQGLSGSRFGLGACEYGDCREGACHYETVPGCCVYDKDCDDSDECTADVCAKISVYSGTGDCSYSNLCCEFDKDCDDSDTCTVDTCDTPNGLCVHSALDCDDDRACTKDSCLGGLCVNKDTDACCDEAENCDDGNGCTVDSCGANGVCQVTKKLGCVNCETETDCVGDCLTGACTDGVCDEELECCGNGQCEVMMGDYGENSSETCASCDADCLDGGGTTCCQPDTVEGGGCDDDGIRDCVCELDYNCCGDSWSALCVNEIGAFECGDACPCLDEL